MSVYRLAIDQTTSAIDRRARFYRNLIVAVVVVILGSVVWAIFAWAWIPLLGCLFLFPICGLYFFLDAQVLQGWRSQLLEPWCQRELDFRAFQPAIEAVPGLPQESLRSMLATLPLSDDWHAEHELSRSTRKAIAVVMTLLHSSRSDVLLSKTLSLTLIGGSLVVAAVLWQWEPLLGIMVGFLFLWLRQVWRSLRVKRCREGLEVVRKHPDFDQTQFQALLSLLSWNPLSDREKETLLSPLLHSQPSQA